MARTPPPRPLSKQQLAALYARIANAEASHKLAAQELHSARRTFWIFFLAVSVTLAAAGYFAPWSLLRLSNLQASNLHTTASFAQLYSRDYLLVAHDNSIRHVAGLLACSAALSADPRQWECTPTTIDAAD